MLAVQTCATIAALAGREKRRCAQLFGYVSRRYDEIGENEYTEIAAHERLRASLSELMSESELAAAVRRGESFDDETAIDVASSCAILGS